MADRRETVPPLDPKTWYRANEVVRDAFRNGQDPVEALHRAGLLVTPARAKAMALATVKELLESMFTWSTVEMLRRRNRDIGSASVADMYTATLGYIGEFITVKEDQKP